MGADAVEVDVQMTLDRQLVCCHDPDLARVADTPLRLAKADLAECRSVYGELATLKDVCLTLPEAGILIDAKSDDDLFIESLQQICEANIQGRVLIGTTNAKHAARIKQRTGLPICGLFKDPVSVAVYRDLEMSWVRLHASQTSREMVSEFHEAGIGTILLANMSGAGRRILDNVGLRLGRSIGCAAYLADNPDFANAIKYRDGPLTRNP